jgi:hypothetical protein
VQEPRRSWPSSQKTAPLGTLHSNHREICSSASGFSRKNRHSTGPLRLAAKLIFKPYLARRRMLNPQRWQSKYLWVRTNHIGTLRLSNRFDSARLQPCRKRPKSTRLIAAAGNAEDITRPRLAIFACGRLIMSNLDKIKAAGRAGRLPNPHSSHVPPRASNLSQQASLIRQRLRSQRNGTTP